MLTYITLPDNIATSTLNISGGLLSDLSPVWIMVLGVILFGIIVTIFFGAFHRH